MSELKKCQQFQYPFYVHLNTKNAAIWIIIIIIIFTISFMQGTDTYNPQTNHVSKDYNVATILSLLFMAPTLLLLLNPRSAFLP